MPSMNMFSKMIAQVPESKATENVTTEQPVKEEGEKVVSEESEEDFNSRSDDEEERVDGSDNDEDLFGELATDISNEEENDNFMFKTSIDDLRKTAAKKDTNIYNNKQESTNLRKESGMMPALSEQLAQRVKRTESGTATPAANMHNSKVPNAFSKASGISGETQGRIPTIPEQPSISEFSKDPKLDINPSVKTKASKSLQSGSRKSFEVHETLEASVKKNFVMQRSKETSNTSTVLSAQISEEESTPECSYSEEKDDEDENEDNFDEDYDYGPVPKSRRNETMIDHSARRTLSMGDFANEFFAPELHRDYERSGPRHWASFSIDIPPTFWEETKSEQEEVDSEHGSAEDEKFREAVQEGTEENNISVWGLVETDENATDEIFRYLRTVLIKAANETALDNLERLKGVFDENRLRKEEITSERDNLIASHINFVGTVAEAMSNMKANSGAWVTLS